VGTAVLILSVTLLLKVTVPCNFSSACHLAALSFRHKQDYTKFQSSAVSVIEKHEQITH